MICDRLVEYAASITHDAVEEITQKYPHTFAIRDHLSQFLTEIIANSIGQNMHQYADPRLNDLIRAEVSPHAQDDNQWRQLLEEYILRNEDALVKKPTLSFVQQVFDKAIETGILEDPHNLYEQEIQQVIVDHAIAISEDIFR